MDPKRILEGNGDEFSQWLIRVADAELPSEAVRNKARAGMLTTLPRLLEIDMAAKVTSSTAAKMKLLFIGKLIGTFLVVFGGFKIYQTKRQIAGIHDTPTEDLSHSQPIKEEVIVVEPLESSKSLSQIEEVANPVVNKNKTDRHLGKWKKRRPKREESGTSDSLQSESNAFNTVQGELSYLKKASRAIQSGHSTKALWVLEEYDLNFEKQHFRPEAEIIKIEAHIELGNSPKALRIAKGYLKAFPENPSVGRVETIVSKIENTKNDLRIRK